jgi:hypothetical protein
MSYRVVVIAVDKFGVVHYTAVRICDTKAEAKAVKAEYDARTPEAISGKGAYMLYVSRKVIIQPATAEAWQEIKDKADAINEKAIPKRDAWAKANMAKYKADGKIRDAEAEYLKMVGWHYDNQQRVNEYNGNMRG